MTKQDIRNEVVSVMKELGTYNIAYDTLIDVFSDTVHLYKQQIADFEEQGAKVEEEYTNKAGATNMRKTPLLSSIEKLRMDIATLTDKLMLNPKSYRQQVEDEKSTKPLSNLERFFENVQS